MDSGRLPLDSAALNALLRFKPMALVLDESHRIKTPEARMTEAVLQPRVKRSTADTFLREPRWQTSRKTVWRALGICCGDTSLKFQGPIACFIGTSSVSLPIPCAPPNTSAWLIFSILPESAPVDQWLDPMRRLYGADAEHIARWLAHRVQRPYVTYKPDIISKLNKLDSSEACCHI
jgi:hypothetical protein